MAEATPAQAKGWDTEVVYTVIRNKTKNSKIVLSALNGTEIAPLHTVDLRTMFKKSQVADASHEIYSLIKSGHLEDMGDGAAVRVEANKSGADQLQDEVRKRIREKALNKINGSSSVSLLEDFLQNKDPEVAKAAKIQLDKLMGLRNDDGQPIPGAEEELANPTQAGGSNIIS